MSDGMTDRRSQSEPVFSPNELARLQDRLSKSIQEKLLNDTAFEHMKVIEVRVLVSSLTNMCLTELMGIRK